MVTIVGADAEAEVLAVLGVGGVDEEEVSGIVADDGGVAAGVDEGGVDVG